MSLPQQIIMEFNARYHESPSTIVRAPGRVNLIGEHTDYNDGFVLPIAIDRATWIALRPRSDHSINLHSLDFHETATIHLDNLVKSDGSSWAEYVKGVAWALMQNEYSLRGWDGIVAGDVPIGAGLSSSAALELATARAFATVSAFPWDPPVMAKLSQKAENQWVGVNCGIMDQMISAAGKADHALLIDCRSLETELVPLPSGTSVIILDTTTRRGLVESAYNERRQSCEVAAHLFGVKALRDLSQDQFEADVGKLDEMIARRARHVITENTRTIQATQVMRRNNPVELGQLMNASHVSLRDDFEVSSDALNQIVDSALHAPGCYGARMTGAGFGGCAVALVQTDRADEFTRDVTSAYEKASGLHANVYVCQATDGAAIIG